MAAKFRVACFSPYPAAGPSVRHRILALAPHWQASGIDLTLYPFMNEHFYRNRRRFDTVGWWLKLAHFLWASLVVTLRALTVRRFDAVIIHREAFPLGPPLVERLICRLAKRSAFDLDDAIWNPPTQEINQRGVFWYPQRTAQIMRACSAVVVGNRNLKEYADAAVRDADAAAATPVLVVPTGYDDLGGKPSGSAAAPVVVWIGNDGNAEYLLPLLPVFQSLATRHRFRLRLIGGADTHDIVAAGVDIERLQWSPTIETEGLLGSDIGIMPLPDSPYERGKCGFKLVQYWSAGLPVVASPVGINCSYVTQENGFLAGAAEEWEQALELLIANRAKRAAMGTAGYRTYLARFTRQACADAWLPLFGRTPGV